MLLRICIRGVNTLLTDIKLTADIKPFTAKVNCSRQTRAVPSFTLLCLDIDYICIDALW